ncbi:MAG: ABC transporter permease [Acidobacteriota bacterium]|nr:ABC transporter permease [Acidobacteriota bacterium]
MRRVLVVAGKEFRHFRHDPLALAMTLVLPVFQLVFYGYALDTKVRRVPTAVINHDAHAAGRQLVERLSRAGLFSLKPEYKTESEILPAMRAGAIKVAIEIPEDYTAALLYRRKGSIKVWVDGADVMISSYVLSALDALGVSLQEAAVQEVELPAELTNRVRVQPRVLFNPKGSTAVFVIPGLLAILVQTITMVLMSLSIAGERERGTLEQMLITPLGVNAILLGKALAIGCVGLVESVLLVLAMQYLFGIAVQGSAVLLISILPILVLAPLGLGLLISALTRNVWQALQVAFVLTLLSGMMSGIIFGREMLAAPIAWCSDLLPATYSIALARNVILRGASVAETGPTIAAATALGIGLIVAGWYASRLRILGRS